MSMGMGDQLRESDFGREVENVDPFEEEWDDAVVGPQHVEMMRLLADTEGADHVEEEVVAEPEVSLEGDVNA